MFSDELIAVLYSEKTLAVVCLCLVGGSLDQCREAEQCAERIAVVLMERGKYDAAADWLRLSHAYGSKRS